MAGSAELRQEQPPALYRWDGSHYHPRETAGSPWSSRGQHGGPPCGLIARAVETWSDDPELVVVRLTVDLFRQVPMAPLAIKVEPVREGRRLLALRASLFGNDRKVARGSALLLRRSESCELATESASPPGPESLTTEPLVKPEFRKLMPPGFHTEVQVRWVPGASGLPVAWLRMPMPLVDGEEPTPLQRAATLSDFSNALANHVHGDRGPEGAGFINTDTTLYLSRPPVGEWICLEVQHVVEHEGVGLVEVAEYDRQGRFGHCAQARLAQSRYPQSPGDA